MAIVTLEQLKGQLRIGHDDEDELITQKINSAQSHLEQLLGFKIATEYPPTEDDPPVSTVPPALVECVLQLAAHWYENREAVVLGGNAQVLPVSVADVVTEFRNWSWAD